MTLTQLRYFCEVARTGNFTDAAKNLYVAQSSISVAIKELESELGLPLFTRGSKKNTTLTLYGEKFLPYATQSLAELESGLLALKEESNSGTVKIGCFVNTTYSLLPWFLKNFDKDNIQINLDIHHTYIDMYPLLLRGEYDLVINTNELPIECCASEKIANQRVFLLVPASSKYAFRDKVTIEDIKDETLIGVVPGSYMDLHIKAMFKAHGLEPKIEYVADFVTQSLEIALGKGIALITKMPIDNKSLAWISVDDPLPNRPVSISWPTNRRLSEASTAVLEHILRISREAGADDLVF